MWNPASFFGCGYLTASAPFIGETALLDGLGTIAKHQLAMDYGIPFRVWLLFHQPPCTSICQQHTVLTTVN